MKSNNADISIRKIYKDYLQHLKLEHPEVYRANREYIEYWLKPA